MALGQSRLAITFERPGATSLTSQTAPILEKKSGFHEVPINNIFFRSGKIDSWKNILTKKQISKIENAFHINMKELGYIK